jgi:hypothetical protein
MQMPVGQEPIGCLDVMLLVGGASPGVGAPRSGGRALVAGLPLASCAPRSLKHCCGRRCGAPGSGLRFAGRRSSGITSSTSWRPLSRWWSKSMVAIMVGAVASKRGAIECSGGQGIGCCVSRASWSWLIYRARCRLSSTIWAMAGTIRIGRCWQHNGSWPDEGTPRRWIRPHGAMPRRHGPLLRQSGSTERNQINLVSSTMETQRSILS